MYKKLYKELIDNAKSEHRSKGNEVYYELHHIVPEFMFKNRKRSGPAGHLDGDCNTVDNFVLLTFREHLLAHYYLYEILKETRYGYSAGSALQFFFIKATSNHIRQKKLSEVDEKFLNEMSHLRELGIASISRARQGKMPVIDAVTKEKIGSVSVNHPKVLSREWVHHSTGRKGIGKGRSQKGSKNANYRKMSQDHIERIYNCVEQSLVDNEYFSRKIFLSNLKKEFIEFKKISDRWVINNFKSVAKLIDRYNFDRSKQIKYNPHYRGIAQRELLSNASKTFRWVTNGVENIRITETELSKFLNKNYRIGRTYA